MIIPFTGNWSGATIRAWIFLGTGLYHLVMGGLCLVSLDRLRALSKFLYALRLPDEIDPRFEYGIRPLGAFALTLAAICLRAVWIPGEDQGLFLSTVLAALFLLRAYFRYRYRDLFTRAFGVPFARSRWNILFNFVLSGILLATYLTPGQ